MQCNELQNLLETNDILIIPEQPDLRFPATQHVTTKEHSFAEFSDMNTCITSQSRSKSSSMLMACLTKVTIRCKVFEPTSQCSEGNPNSH